MKKRRVIVVVAGCLVLSSATLVLWLDEREPRYNGRSLSEWLVRCDASVWPEEMGNVAGALPGEQIGKASFVRMDEANDAVRCIGTNALPWLLRRVSYHPPPWTRKLDALMRKLPGAPRPSFEDRAEEQGLDAVRGFKALGQDAAPAIPELLRIVAAADPITDDNVLGRVGPALAGIGKPALAPMLAFVTDPNRANRDYVVNGIGAFGYGNTNAAPAVPVLVRCLGDLNEQVAVEAVRALGVLQLEPATTIAALTNSLRDTRQLVRLNSAQSLGKLGARAHSAAPALIAALNDPDRSVRYCATNALHQILALDALEKALSQ